LRYRVPLVIFVTFLAAAAVFISVLSGIVLNSYTEDERASVVDDTRRVEAGLAIGRQRLEGSAADWAQWDDSYEYLAGRNESFVRENLTAASVITNIGADFVAVFTSQDTLKWGGAVVPGSDVVHPLSPDLATALRGRVAVLRPTAVHDGLAGIMLLAGTPTLFASHLVTNNDLTAPPNGFLVMGRFVDADETRQVSDTTGLSVTLSTPVTQSTTPADSGAARAVTVSYADQDHLIGSMLLPGADGLPALGVAISKTVQSTTRARQTQVIAGWASLGLVVAFGAFLAIALQTTVLRRLTRLQSRTVQALENRASAYSVVGGRDEIADLALALDEAEERVLHNEALLRYEADHDSLTGLANRRRLVEDATKSIAEAARSGAHVAMALLDLDGLKLINDTHGHDCGDQVLMWFGAKILSVVRDYSTVARTGGDEFAILLPQTSGAEAERVLSRLTSLLAAEPCSCDAGLVGVSACIGIAAFPDDAAAFEELMHVADERMYDQKRIHHGQTMDVASPNDI
jgi:diguanylate cyclase (GGDEF)-like protein